MPNLLMEIIFKDTVRLPYVFQVVILFLNLSKWPRGLRRRSAVTRLLRLCVRIPPGAVLSVVCFQVQISATS